MQSYPKRLNSRPSIKFLSGFISLSMILSGETPVIAATSLVSSQQQPQAPALTPAQLAAQQANQEAAMNSRNAVATPQIQQTSASLPSNPTYPGQTYYTQSADGRFDVYLKDRVAGSSIYHDVLVFHNHLTGNQIGSDIRLDLYSAQSGPHLQNVLNIQFTPDGNHVGVFHSALGTSGVTLYYYTVFSSVNANQTVNFSDMFNLQNVVAGALDNQSITLTYTTNPAANPSQQVTKTDKFFFGPVIGKLIATNADATKQVFLTRWSSYEDSTINEYVNIMDKATGVVTGISVNRLPNGTGNYYANLDHVQSVTFTADGQNVGIMSSFYGVFGVGGPLGYNNYIVANAAGLKVLDVQQQLGINFQLTGATPIVLANNSVSVTYLSFIFNSQTLTTTLGAVTSKVFPLAFSMPNYTEFYAETSSDWIRLTSSDLWSISSGSGKPNYDYQFNTVTGELRASRHLVGVGQPALDWNVYQVTDKNNQPVEWFKGLLRMTQSLQTIKNAPANAAYAAAIQALIDKINAAPIQQKVFTYTNGTVNSGNFTQPNYQDLLLTKTDSAILFRAVPYDIFAYQSYHQVQAYKFDFATGKISFVDYWQTANTVSNAPWVVIDPAVDPAGWSAKADVLIAELSKTSDQQTAQSSKDEIQTVIFRINTYRQSAQLTTVLNQIQASASNRNDFNLLFGTNIPASGNISAADRGVLANLVFDPAFMSTSFFAALPKTAGLYRGLISDASQLANFNTIFGSTLASSGPLNAADRKALFDVAGDTAFDQFKFIAAMPKVVALNAALQSDAASRTRFNTLFGSSLQASGALSANDRKALFDAIGDAAVFVQNTFLSILAKTTTLLTSLQSDASARANFNALFGAGIPASGTLTAADRTALFGVTGDPGYDPAVFPSALIKATALLDSLRSNTSGITAFNLLFGTSVTATNVGTADIKTLFGVVGDPDYGQANFLMVLSKAHPLYIQLQSDSSQLSQFNLLFGSTLNLVGPPTAANRTLLFSAAGDPNFNQTAFLTVLDKAVGLTFNLWLNTDRMNRFNDLFGAQLAPEVTPDAVTRGILFNTTGDPSFNLAAFLPALDRTAYLLYNLWLSPDRLNKFNWWKGANLSSDVPVSDAASRKALFDLAGDPAFSIQDYFAKVLDKALAPALYKFYYAPYNQWFFSADPKEITLLPTYGWVNYGAVGYISTTQTASTTALYRLVYSSGGKSYFYATANVQEKNNLLAGGWSLHSWNNGIAGYISTTQTTGTVPIYKVYHPSGVRYMTSSLQELNNLVAQGWVNQGVTGYAPVSKPTVDPVINNRLFKFYSPTYGQWFFSSNANEIKQLVAGGWIAYGDAGIISATQTAGTIPLYRLYVYTGGKYYFISTSSAQEKSGLLAGGWLMHSWNNGIAGYINAAGPAAGTVAMYRLRHPSGIWYFSTSAQEISNLIAGGWVVEGVTGFTTPVKPLAPGAPAAPNRLYKFYNASMGQWFFSANTEEIKQLIAGGWVITGNAGTISPTQTVGTVALYRLYVYTGGRHYFYNTTSLQEKATLLASGWVLHPWNNGIAGYVYPAQSAGTTPLYRVYHSSGVWYWTSSLSERQKLIAAGWVDYGISSYLTY